eukprot:31106-Chlamydomonas_euryale.AAC.1
MNSASGSCRLRVLGREGPRAMCLRCWGALLESVAGERGWEARLGSDFGGRGRGALLESVAGECGLGQ